MKVLVDACIWSEALRRRSEKRHSIHREELQELIREQRVVLAGPIRQEILSGIRSIEQFNLVRDHLSAFEDTPFTSRDYELAATCFTTCRQHGLQGSNTDFLLCAIALNHSCSIYTLDKDFSYFAKYLPLHLHRPRE